MPVDQSSGWLLHRALDQELLLHHEPQKLSEMQIGFGLDDPDWDPAFDADAEPPPGYESLPFHESSEVNDGE